MNLLGPSWRTSLGGLLALLGGSVSFLPDTAPGSHFLKAWGPYLATVGTGLGLMSARDHKASDEQSGAGNVPPKSVDIHDTLTKT